MPDPTRTPSRRGHATIERYGKDFVGARAREGLVQREMTKARGGHPELLTRDEANAIRRQVWRRQAALMRAAKAMKRATRLAEAQALAEAERGPR